jgi:hypothetical protein
MKTIKVNSSDEVPENFTGIAEFSKGSKNWYKNGKRHREDGPAYEGYDGLKVWYKDGKKHRLDGPAIEDVDYKAWYIDGLEYYKDEYFEALTPEQKQKFIWSEYF